MGRRTLHPLVLLLSLAIFAAQGVGAVPISGLMWCLGCPGGEPVVSQLCLPEQVAACCDEGEPVGASGTADASCGCIDVPVEREHPDTPPVQPRAASELSAPPLVSPLPLIVAPEPAVCTRSVTDLHAPPRETVPRLRFTVLIV